MFCGFCVGASVVVLAWTGSLQHHTCCAISRLRARYLLQYLDPDCHPASEQPHRSHFPRTSVSSTPGATIKSVP